MKVIPSGYNNDTELPLKLKISFESIFEYLEKVAGDESNFLHKTAIDLLEEYKAYPELRDGFEDFDYLNKYNAQISKLLDILFPELLQSNEIKAASIPFEFTTFKFSKRFLNILENAGDDYKFELFNYDHSNIYIMNCTFILGFCYGHMIDFRRPFFFEIPDKKSGLMKHYRTMYNGDFFKVKPLENAPEITEEDVKLLLDNFHNIDIWKEKFPPNSYEFKGFGMMNLFDVTSDQSISKLKENLLRKDDEAFFELEQSISNLYGSKDIKFGFSTYDSTKENVAFKKYKNHHSFLANNACSANCVEFFCDGIVDKVFKKEELIAISDIEAYGKNTQNDFSKVLLSQDIHSLILVPLRFNENLIGVLELVSKNKYELNSINAHKLEDVIPVFIVAIKRYMEEFENKLESVIQENYTSLHPTVKWRFKEEAEEYVFNQETNDAPETNLKNIVFDDVVPLYGQSDIKGSSTARNTAIQKDLVKQLDLATDIIKKAEKKYKMPIYSDLLFRINQCLHNIEAGLNSGDEISLTDFLKKDIYPVFRHLRRIDDSFKVDIQEYMNHLDTKLHVVYDKRKKYETSVNILNEEMAKFIDATQIEAQKMFPHYFERYKTDGIDYNMYIGQSLVKNHEYNDLYLHNLRLWQLQMMCELEGIVHRLSPTLDHPLEVASLILVHSTPLSIKFRMDEKRFDVDGAYNIRYEIIKKRIDKALIKNTTERLTQPGKIAIVYAQSKDAYEYMKYITYLQSKNYLLESIENVDLQDLQGISGLKALRVSINYDQQPNEKITMDDLMNAIVKEKLN